MGTTEIMTRETGELRSIETITEEILNLKKTAGESILTIGHRLIEAKGMLSHGEWTAWLAEKVEFSPRTAQNFMRLSREWTNTQALADLGATKALVLLALPADEREDFLAETHTVNGEEKQVIDMSARQLEQVIKERDEARWTAEAAAADAKNAQAARAKMAEDMTMLKGLLESAEADKATAEKAMEAVREDLRAVEQELAALKAAPVEVAVMEADQAALEQARREAAETARADMLDELEKARTARDKAVEKRKAAEKSLNALKQQLEVARAAERKAALAADKDMVAFELLFNQAQEIANKMQGLLIKARGRENSELAGKLEKAMQALAGAIGRAAE